VLDKIKREVKRFNEMARAISGDDGNSEMKIKEKSTDVKAYIKYILRHGKTEEKREILSNLSSKLILKEKKIDTDD